MRKVVAVVGSADVNGDIGALAFGMGKLLVENGYVLATGGLGGVMEHASRGGRAADNYTDGSVIGVIPGYDVRAANPHLDRVIPSGMGVGRNVLLVSMAAAVIAIGGGAGTLSEIAIAWQMRKLIIALGSSGWSGELAGRSIDDRRDDVILGASSPPAAIELLARNISKYSANHFTGIPPAP